MGGSEVNSWVDRGGLCVGFAGYSHASSSAVSTQKHVGLGRLEGLNCVRGNSVYVP